MKRLLLPAGIAMLLFCAQGARAANTLFDRIETLVQAEQTATPEVVTFTAAVLRQTMLSGAALPVADVENEVRAVASTEVEGILCMHWSRMPNCHDIERVMRDTIRREMETVRLGHKLQIIATSYEEPLSTYSLQPEKLNAAYAEVLRVWGLPQSFSGALTSVRAVPAPQSSTFWSAIASLGFDLNALPAEQHTAAVWRYQYGLSFVRDRSKDENPDGQSGPGTERQFLFKRVPALETDLAQMRDAIAAAIDPPLAPGELAIGSYPVQNDVIAWFMARRVKNPDGTATLFTNAGLRWKQALEPVLPSLLSFSGNDPIPGGSYPPLPQRQSDGSVVAAGGGGLCATSAGGQGYLCRDRAQRFAGSGNCLEAPPAPEADTVILSPCTLSSSTGALIRAGDICARLRPEGTSSSSLAPPCTPGSEAAYPYTIIGHACYIRECAERTIGGGHVIVPGREPLVSQETTQPWAQCRTLPADPPTLSIPPPTTLPFFPAYEPGMQMRNLLIEYCRLKAKPPLLPPVLCQTSALSALELRQAVPAATPLVLTREEDAGAQEEQMEAAEAMGEDAGAALYRDYLRKVTASIDGALQSTIASLERLARGTFPTTMCPLNPQDDLTFCPLPLSETNP